VGNEYVSDETRVFSGKRLVVLLYIDAMSAVIR
jgi:hypothetical protein